MKIVFFVFFLAGVLLFAMNNTMSDTLTINGKDITVEVVQVPSPEATKGLSGRASLDQNAGMLFLYEKPATPSFWMKDMRFPIDIIWIGEDKMIREVTENVSPDTFPQQFTPSFPIIYVLEVNAGWAKEHNVSIGDPVKLNLVKLSPGE